VLLTATIHPANMSDKRQIAYKTVASVDETAPPAGARGRRLFILVDPIRYFVVGIMVYGIASLAIAGWALSCPPLGVGHRVLRTGSLKVDQFYSGLALSAIFAPAGIMIRRLSNDLSLLHPFAVSFRKKVTISDMDRMTDPGILAVVTLGRYSIGSSVVQAILMLAGAFMVPIGTLLITTDEYSAPVRGTGVVGLPTEFGGAMVMSIEIGTNTCPTKPCYPTFGQLDFFLTGAIDLFQASLVKQSGVFQTVPSPLGPGATANLTYEEGVTYDGIMTINWDSGCHYTDDISFNQHAGSSEWIFDYVWPNGTKLSNIDVWDGVTYIWSDSDIWVQDGTVPIGGSTYFILAGFSNQTLNFDQMETGIHIIEGPNGAWTSLVKCTPSLNWQVSQCTWKNDQMTDCEPAPGHNTAVLDDPGLDVLHLYMTAVPWTIYMRDDYVFGRQTLQVGLMYAINADNQSEIVAPSLEDFNNLYGLVAQGISSYSTTGYYGTCVVPTIGSSPRPVYIIRMYILVIVVAILVGVPLLTGFNLFAKVMRHLPLRRATFLTIANAVRGPWWDTTLYGGCALTPSELRERHKNEKVAFGADVNHPQHVGLAPEVHRVEDETMYLGIREQADGVS